LFTSTAAVFVEVGKSRTLRDSKLAADATAYGVAVVQIFRKPNLSEQESKNVESSHKSQSHFYFEMHFRK
jgi:hypothetical protein